MKLTILGCGRYNITSNYNSTGNLLQTSQLNILLDFGRGNLHALTQSGMHVGDIDVICISHTHPDHVADLLAFFQIYFIEKYRGHITKPLTIIGPVGITQWYQQLAQLMFEVVPEIMIYENPTQPLQLGDVTITVTPMHHIIPDVAYKIQGDRASVVYSGDTGFNTNLLQLAYQTNSLVLECSNSSNEVSEFHLNPQQCGQIAEQAKAKQLILTHYGAKERAVGLERETAKYFSGIVTVAKELLTITV